MGLNTIDFIVGAEGLISETHSLDQTRAGQPVDPLGRASYRVRGPGSREMRRGGAAEHAGGNTARPRQRGAWIGCVAETTLSPLELRLRTQSAHQIMTAAKATEDAKLRESLS
jgi:hypothetical protein